MLMLHPRNASPCTLNNRPGNEYNKDDTYVLMYLYAYA